MSGAPFETLSFSSMSTFYGYAACQRAWFYRYIEHAPPDKPKGQRLALGNAFDAGAKAIMDGKIQGEDLAIEDAIAVTIDQWNTDMQSGEYDLTDGENTPILLPAAIRTFKAEVAPDLVPVETQVPVRLKFNEVDWELVGKIDLLAESQNHPGYLDIWDTKATDRRQFDTYKPAVDLQVNLYDLCIEAPSPEHPDGRRVDQQGFIVGRILKTKTEVEAISHTASAAAREATLDLVGSISLAIEQACEAGNFPPTAFLADHWKCGEKYCEYWLKTCPFGKRARTTFAIGGDDA